MGTPVLVVLAAGAGRRFGGAKQLAPVGPSGETLMDYTLDRALRAGFERVVIVIRPDLDEAFRDHLGRLGWSSVSLAAAAAAALVLAHQPPGTAGTVPAVLAARRYVGEAPFAVVNADDLYPASAIEALQEGPAAAGHAVLGFRLAATIAPGSGPVNRALCRVDDDGHGRLLGLTEATITTGGRGRDRVFTARSPGVSTEVAVPGDHLVSMNAWRFQPSIWADLEAAMEAPAPATSRGSVASATSGGSRGSGASGGSGGSAASGGSAPAGGSATSGGSAASGAAPAGEVLLPVVVDSLVVRGAATVTVIPVTGGCVGITWPGELATVRDTVGRMVAAGELPARILLHGAVE